MPFRLFIASGCVKALFGFAACKEKRREGHYPIRWDSTAMDLSFCLLHIQLKEQRQSCTRRSVAHLWVSLSCPALKSIRSTGYECQSYFVELTSILSLLQYKGEPRLQEAAGLLWFVPASTFQLNQNEKSEVTEMLRSPKQPFNLSL